MKMKFPLLFSLLLAPQLAFGQSALTNKQKTDQLANLIEDSAASYRKVATYSGTIKLTTMDLNGKEIKPFLESQVQTVYRLDKAGNKIREISTFSSDAKVYARPSILKVVDDGKIQTRISLKSKTYARTPRYSAVAPFAVLSHSLKQIARALRQDDSAVSSLSSKTAAGSLTVLSSKGGKVFDTLYAVIDDKTGTLKTLDFSTGKRAIRIRVTNEVFNGRLKDSQFRWTPPANFKRVSENQLINPTKGLVRKPKPTAAPVY